MKVVMRIARCLRCTAKLGMCYKLDMSRGVEVFANADFSGNWSKENSIDPKCVMSRIGCVIVIFG